MTTASSIAKRLAGWLQICGVFFIASGLMLAWGAAGTVFLRGWHRFSPWVFLGFLAYAILAGAAIFVFRRLYRKGGPRLFLPVLLGASLAIQIGIISSTNPDWTGSIDAGLFRHFLDRLAEKGYAPDTLEKLSRFYDYPLWTRRAAPLHLALRIWSGPHFVRVMQLTQALLLTLSLALTWRLALLLFGRRVAFWASTFQFVMPYQWMACLDMNHHVTGVFYFLCALWILAEWFRPRPPAGWCRWGLAFGAGLLLPLMGLGGYMDKIYAVSVFLTLAFLRIGGKLGNGQTIRAAIGLLVWPVLAGAILLAPLAHRIDRSNVHRLASPLGYVGSGWSPESGGEYSETCVQLDVLTPIEDKNTALGALLASRAAYTPGTIVGRLLPAKIVKFFLLGYASGSEELLAQNGAVPAADLAKGARTAFLLGALPLMAWGAILLLPLLGRLRRFHFILPCAIFCVGIVALWEISPRYSGYVQPFLFMLAALPLAWASRRRRLLRAAKRPVFAALFTGLAAFGIAAGGLYGARPWLQRHAFEDLRKWTVAGGQAKSISPALEPLELHLLPRFDEGKPAWGPVLLPPAPDRPGQLRFYVLADGNAFRLHPGMQLVAEYATAQGHLVRTCTPPAFVQFDYQPGMPGSLKWRSIPPATAALRIGYASFADGIR